MVNNLYKTYKQQSVMTMTSGDLLIALYDGLLKELSQAQNSFKQNNYADINRDLKKVQLMLGHLKSTLNFDYEISNNLAALYDYFIDVVKKANLKKDPTGLDEVTQMIAELRDAFYQANRKTRAIASNS
ncbi:MAG TPA: flagellar export chaperone FliS [Clostridiales bacterium]|jgi:flagellar protein FliS|nr:flagellar export chaperone FliS [Clostridiales bacterium]